MLHVNKQTAEEKISYFSAWGVSQPLVLQSLPLALGCEETLTVAAPRLALASSYTLWDAGTRREVPLSASHTESALGAPPAPLLGRAGARTPAHQTPATWAGARGFQDARTERSCARGVDAVRRLLRTRLEGLKKPCRLEVPGHRKRWGSEGQPQYDWALNTPQNRWRHNWILVVPYRPGERLKSALRLMYYDNLA